MKKVILAVDDEPLNLQLLEAILIPQGFRVETATNGEEALDKIRLLKLDTILLDVMMPVMNGHEVCRRIRENKNWPYIPVIFITASEVDQDSIVKGLDSGGDDYIRKPIDSLELLSRIRACLRVKSLYDELNRTKAELSRYVSLSTRKMVEGMTTGDAQPANRSAEVTILFSDIRGFTEISENMEPESIFTMLNDNLTKQIKIIERNSGIIDKLSGDEVMAVFEGPGMVTNALKCAIQIVEALSFEKKENNQEWFKVGIGINTGQVYLGSLGSETFRDYTVIGNIVNVAARLCGLAIKRQILFTDMTQKQIQSLNFEYRSIGKHPVKGLKKPIEIYELLNYGTKSSFRSI